MSFWVIAQVAANKAVVAPMAMVASWMVGYALVRGETRIRRNTPATTMVDLWSKAETGVGPSIAAGSQG